MCEVHLDALSASDNGQGVCLKIQIWSETEVILFHASLFQLFVYLDCLLIIICQLYPNNGQRCVD